MGQRGDTKTREDTKQERERGEETKSDKKAIWQREEAQCISWDLISASSPCHRSSCLRLNEAPSVMGSLHPSSLSLQPCLKTQHKGGEGGKHGGVVTLTLKWGWMGESEARLTGEVSGLLHRWHVQYELWSAVRCRFPLVQVLPFSTGPKLLWRFQISHFTADPCTAFHWKGFRNKNKNKQTWHTEM